jgi:hypothetical protein
MRSTITYLLVFLRPPTTVSTLSHEAVVNAKQARVQPASAEQFAGWVAFRVGMIIIEHNRKNSAIIV